MSSEELEPEVAEKNPVKEDKRSSPSRFAINLLSPAFVDLNDQTQNLTLDLLQTQDDQVLERPLDPKVAAKIERQNQRKAQREKSKLDREHEKEQERQLKLQRKETEKLQREKKKEEGRLNKEFKKQQDALQREQKKQEEKERKEQGRLLKKQLLEEERAKRREEKKRKLEEENKKKEDEKRRKDERSQMRISSFFSVSLDSAPSLEPIESLKGSLDREEVRFKAYDADFLPFFQKKNVVMAPTDRLRQEDLEKRKKEFQIGLESGSRSTAGEIFDIVSEQPCLNYTTSQQLVEALNSSSLTENTVVQLFKKLPPIKYLRFYENSKPPYVGTWCSEEHLKVALTPANPLDTSLTSYDYGYDSDLDWQEEGEGDDIDDLEDGEEEEEDGDDDMDDFVDNSELSKSCGLIGPLRAVSICNDGSSANQAIFDCLKYESLDINITFPINPYGNYWGAKTTISQYVPSESPAIPTIASEAISTDQDTFNIIIPQKPVIKDPKVVEELIKFIKKNSDFTIGTLTELAKKEFKTYTKNILKYTIQSVAIYNKKENGWKIKGSV